MRITPFMIFNQLTRSLSRTLEDYNRLNDALATGKKINAPSEDPGGLMRGIDYRVTINANGQYQRNIDFAVDRLNLTGTVMSSVYDTFANIQKLVAKNTRARDPLSQAADADEAATYRDMLHDLANTKIMNQYLFSGFRSNTRPFADGEAAEPYGYAGDAGEVNVPINNTGASMALNVPGSQAFGYTLAAQKTVELSDGRSAEYTPVVDPLTGTTTVTMEVRAADGNIVQITDADGNLVDNLSFSNVIQMVDLLRSAIGAGDTTMVEALAEPFTRMQEQLMSVQTDVGGRVTNLKSQSALLEQNDSVLHEALSSLEDADPMETIAKIKQTEVTLMALRDSASRVLSQSLFDFLR